MMWEIENCWLLCWCCRSGVIGSKEPRSLFSSVHLAHLRSTKRQNSRQARWSLFLSCFHYTLSFRPGCKNGKPATWEIKNKERNHPNPSSGPPNRLFVPEEVRPQVLLWVYIYIYVLAFSIFSSLLTSLNVSYFIFILSSIKFEDCLHHK